MINKDFFLALDELEKTKKISKQFFIKTLEDALVAAYKKNFGEGKAVEVRLIPERNTIRVIAYKTVVDEVEDSDTQISLADAKGIKKNVKIGDIISEEVTPKEFGRIAAGTAKQVVTQRLREAERSAAFKELEDKLEQLVTGIVRRIENGTVFVELSTSQVEGVLMPNDQIPGENYKVNDRIKVYIKKLREGIRGGTQAIVSRTCTGFVRRLFEAEVPEIVAGLVSIKSIVREAGYRTKIAVNNEDKTIDALGACVGNRGVRVNAIIAELGGEKIDIVEWSEDPFEYIARALSPAKVLEVQVNDELHSSLAIVPNDKLSLAIGKSGQNVRLASKLTGWKIDVKSESQYEEMTKTVRKIDENSNSSYNVESNSTNDVNLEGLFDDISIDEEVWWKKF